MSETKIEIPLLSGLTKKVEQVVHELATQAGQDPQTYAKELMSLSVRDRAAAEWWQIDGTSVESRILSSQHPFECALERLFRGALERLLHQLPTNAQKMRVSGILGSKLPCCQKYLERELLVVSHLPTHWLCHDGAETVLAPLLEFAKAAEEGGEHLHPESDEISACEHVFTLESGKDL